MADDADERHREPQPDDTHADDCREDVFALLVVDGERPLEQQRGEEHEDDEVVGEPDGNLQPDGPEEEADHRQRDGVRRLQPARGGNRQQAGDGQEQQE
jgi:hypothetical protein